VARAGITNEGEKTMTNHEARVIGVAMAQALNTLIGAQDHRVLFFMMSTYCASIINVYSEISGHSQENVLCDFIRTLEGDLRFLNTPPEIGQ